MREKNLNEVLPECQGLYQQGCAACDQGDWDRAIALFNQVLNQEPGLVECREALRKAQLARTEKGGFVKHAIVEVRNILDGAKAKVYLRSKPSKAIPAAEQMLNRIPASIPAHKILAIAALKSGMYRTAFLSLDFIRNHGGRENLDTNLELANALAESGRASEGLALCGRLLKEYPENRQVTRALERLSRLAFHEHDAPTRRVRSSSGFHNLPRN